MDPADLQHRFAFHAASTEEKRASHGTVREACLQAAMTLDGLAPDCREKSLAVTALEEAMFWGNAAIARSRNS